MRVLDVINGIPLMGIMGYESLLLMDINGIYHPEPRKNKKTINCALFAFWVVFIRTRQGRNPDLRLFDGFCACCAFFAI